nr:NADH dehydrogenase subunit 2 [Chiropterargas confusus]
MKLTKLLMINMMIMSIMMALSSSSLFYLWMTLEINMMSFVPMLLKKDQLSSYSMFIYFIIQTFSSSIFIMTIYALQMPNYWLISLLVTLSMSMKLAAAPFHMWLTEMSEGVSLHALGIALTLQKIIPLYIMSMFQNNILILFIMACAIMGSMGGFNQFSIHKLLVYSSVTHMAWMMCLIKCNNSNWLIYLMTYMMSLMMLVYVLNKMNYFHFLHSNFITNELKLMTIILLLAVGGMPPTAGFFMKWMSLKLIMFYMPMISLILILSSLINMYLYMRMAYPLLLFSNTTNKWYININSMFYLYLLIQLTLILIIIPMT